MGAREGEYDEKKYYLNLNALTSSITFLHL